jgi:hypothetical protein
MEEEAFSAGEFSAWLSLSRAALDGAQPPEVPCGECNGCCKSSYFIHVGPDEHEALDSIPRELLFDAPGLPKGHLILGYNESGCCPMLVAEMCSIYDSRPRTCRVYDCRVFTAAGLDPGKPAVEQRTKRWRFSFPAEQDRLDYRMVQAAGRFLAEHPDSFPARSLPSNPAQLAVMAIRSYAVFSASVDDRDGAREEQPTAAIAAAMLVAAGRA